MGKKANVFKAQYLHRSGGRKCGEHKCEGHASYLGRSVILLSCFELGIPRGTPMEWQKSAEAIVALLLQSEGLNINERE